MRGQHAFHPSTLEALEPRAVLSRSFGFGGLTAAFFPGGHPPRPFVVHASVPRARLMLGAVHPLQLRSADVLRGFHHLPAVPSYAVPDYGLILARIGVPGPPPETSTSTASTADNAPAVNDVLTTDSLGRHLNPATDFPGPPLNPPDGAIGVTLGPM